MNPKYSVYVVFEGQDIAGVFHSYDDARDFLSRERSTNRELVKVLVSSKYDLEGLVGDDLTDDEAKAYDIVRLVTY